MDPDTIDLASRAVTTLMAYFMTLGKEAAKEGAKKLGSQGAEKALQLYGAVKAKLAGTPRAQALEALRDAPQDPAAQAALREALEEALQRDEALRPQIASLVAVRTDVTQSAEQKGDKNVSVQMTGAGKVVIKR